jgi:hypothetical protein
VTGVLLFKHSCLHFLFADAIFLRGRTLPNLHDALHCDADILQLDVIAVGEVADAAISAVVPEKCPVPCSETHGPLSNFPASNLLKLHMQMLPARHHHSLVGLAQSMVLQLQIQRSQSDGRFHLPKQALLLNYCLSSDRDCNILLISSIVASLAASAEVILAQSSSTLAVCASSLE